ncbi:hypothetical protein ACFOHT_02535 [Massilia oculi]|jgi:hypothetical protein|uniref:hypothetical protein n=1 Tax=Massilia oculi TaxID=945844 RepID=UPI0013B3B49A|nr:hypothetical protein [Massilia oculi]
MATKKRAQVPAPSPDDPKRPESETENVDADVERVDSDASPVIDSVEDSEGSANRADIESGGETDAGDVERGPA